MANYSYTPGNGEGRLNCPVFHIEYQAEDNAIIKEIKAFVAEHSPRISFAPIGDHACKITCLQADYAEKTKNWLDRQGLKEAA